MKINKRLKEIIEEKGISQYRLCKDAGLNQGNVSHFLNTGKGISIAKLQLIFDYLGVEFVINCEKKREREKEVIVPDPYGEHTLKARLFPNV